MTKNNPKPTACENGAITVETYSKPTLTELLSRFEMLAEMVGDTLDGKPPKWRSLNTDDDLKPMTEKEFLDFLWEQMINLHCDLSEWANALNKTLSHSQATVPMVQVHSE